MGTQLMLEVAQVATALEGQEGALASPVNLLLLWTLADKANDKTRQCWPGQPRLARSSRLSERTIRSGLQALKADGHIEIDLRPGRSTIYTVHPGRTCHPQQALPRQQVPPPRQEMPVGLQKETPARGADEPYNHTHLTGARSGEPGDEKATAEQMAELRRALDRAAKASRVSTIGGSAA